MVLHVPYPVKGCAEAKMNIKIGHHHLLNSFHSKVIRGTALFALSIAVWEC